MTNDAQSVPFGLTFRVPLPADLRQTMTRTVVRDQQRQMAIFTGRPLSELAEEEMTLPSLPTQNDGKDSIAVDSDPFYD
jgi:hypothetical protein